MAHMFLSSQHLAYFSSVVILISAPALIGISFPPSVSPVRISGPFYSQTYLLATVTQPFLRTRRGLGNSFLAQDSGRTVSRAIANCLPVIAFSALRALSITDWWYCVTKNKLAWVIAKVREWRAPKHALRENSRYRMVAMRKIHANNVKTSYKMPHSARITLSLR